MRRVLEETLTLREYDLKVNNVLARTRNSRGSALGSRRSASVGAGLPEHHQQRARCHGRRQRTALLKVRVFRKDAYVCVEFDDSGPGIKDPEPDFRSLLHHEIIGKGTGLGLSICYGIVKEHGGEIVARNRREGGATIEVRLLASEKPCVPGAGDAARRESIARSACCWWKTKKRCWNLNATCWSGQAPKSPPQ